MGENKIIIFPGNQQEYEKWRGYKVEVVDTGRDDKGIFLSEAEWWPTTEEGKKRIGAKLKKEGVEALINAQYSFATWTDEYHKNPNVSERHYGLPVRRKRRKK